MQPSSSYCHHTSRLGPQAQIPTIPADGGEDTDINSSFSKRRIWTGGVHLCLAWHCGGATLSDGWMKLPSVPLQVRVSQPHFCICRCDSLLSVMFKEEDLDILKDFKWVLEAAQTIPSTTGMSADAKEHFGCKSANPFQAAFFR